MDCLQACQEHGRTRYHADLESYLKVLIKGELQSGEYPLLRTTKPRSSTRPTAIRTGVLVRSPFVEGRGRNLEIGSRELIYNIHACIQADWKKGIKYPCDSSQGKTLIRPVIGHELIIRKNVTGFDLEEHLLEYLPGVQELLRQGAYERAIAEVLAVTEVAGRLLFPERPIPQHLYD